MTNDQNIGELDGYGYEPETTTGKYVRLKKKGDSAVFRIVSNPCRFFADIVDQKTGDTIRKERFGWIVAHKEQETVTGPDGKPKQQTKITIRGFEAGVAIWIAIKKFAQDEDNYGDPRTYDFKITRTEAPGSYYDVVVLPKSIGKPIEGLAEMIQESGLTLQELFLSGKVPQSKATDQGEYDPFTDE